MAITDSEPHPWLLEDLELRWSLSADRLEEAAGLARRVHATGLVDEVFRIREYADELAELHRRVRAYEFHCRETNLVAVIRRAHERGDEERIGATRDRLLEVFALDTANRRNADLAEVARDFSDDPVAASAVWFGATPATPDPARYVREPVYGASRGYFSVTSR